MKNVIAGTCMLMFYPFSSKRARRETTKFSHDSSQPRSHDSNRPIFSCVFLTGHDTGVTENQHMNMVGLSNWL